MNISGHKSETSIKATRGIFVKKKTTMKCALCYKTKTSARFDTSKVEDTDNQLQLGPNNQMLDPIGQDQDQFLNDNLF